MRLNKEDLKNKIIYRSLYRGTKEMDIMVSTYVKKIINKLSYKDLLQLDEIINLDDEAFIELSKVSKSSSVENSKKINFMRKHIVD